VGGDATTIDLNLIPQVVEFEGFINYGSPINAVGVQTLAGAVTTSVPVVLTQNVINQPVFSTRKVTTSVSVYDGQTVVIGGLILATLLTLFIVPSLYYSLEKIAERWNLRREAAPGASPAH
jgi:Flp pilus assembly secretin CpaC